MRIAIIILGVFLALLAKQVVVTWRGLQSVEPVNTFASCEKIFGPGTVGVEDLAVHPVTGIAYLAANNRRKTLRGEVDPDVGIYMLDLKNKDQKKPVKMILQNFETHEDDFFPHGIGLLIVDKTEVRDLLFMISHSSSGKDVVDIFLIGSDRLTWYDRISHPLFKSLNDIAPFGTRAFYVTNDHQYFSATHPGVALEEFSGICKGNVVLFDGPVARTEIVLDNLCFPNGVILSPNKKYIYVAESITGNLVIAGRFNNASLSAPILSVPINTMVDNINISPKSPNELYIAGHPNGMVFAKHMMFGGNSYSDIVKVTIGDDPTKQAVINSKTKVEVTRLLQSDGSDISGSSVAGAFGDTMVIGSVFDDHILVCKTK